MNDLSPETNELLELARGAGGLTDTRRSQIKSGLLAQIATIGLISVTSATAGAGATAAATAGKAAWLSSSLAKAVSALALVSVTSAGAYAVVRSQARHEAEKHVAAPAQGAAPRAPAHSAPVVAAPDPTAGELADPAPPSPAPAEKTANNSAHSAAPSVANAETLADETRLLRDADQALRAGNAQRALSLLDEHASRYPRGVLAPERSAERMLARCKLGQVEAKAAQAYLASHANSAFAPRIRDACGVQAP